MNEFDYSDDAEIHDWNTGIDNRYLKLLAADGVTTMGQLLELNVGEWAHGTKGAGGKAMDKIAAAKTTIGERRRAIHGAVRCTQCSHRRDQHSLGKYACDTLGCADNCQRFIDPSLPAVEPDNVALARASLIRQAVTSLESMQKVLDNEQGWPGWENLEDRIAMVHAQIRALLGELKSDPVAEQVSYGEALRAVISELDQNVSADPVTLFDNAQWCLAALTGSGWLIVRADAIQS
jgi:hypothetical protein